MVTVEEFRENNKVEIKQLKENLDKILLIRSETSLIGVKLFDKTSEVKCPTNDCETCPLNSDNLCFILSSINGKEWRSTIELYQKAKEKGEQ